MRAPALDPDAALGLYRTMLQVRLVDERMLRLQRQGRLGFYMTSTGEEATHLAVAALEMRDWVFPSYREPGAAFFRGYSIQEFTNQLFGDAEDPVKGRQMPVHHTAKRLNFVSISSPVGTQIPQAVGMAMGVYLVHMSIHRMVYAVSNRLPTPDLTPSAHAVVVIFLSFAAVWALMQSPLRRFV